ncbi:MAG: PAS domain-containing protein [Deltaproteobacteria bacterium]|nr:PAS domain-containing protein [Deltaproteobacteria bacterium]
MARKKPSITNIAIVGGGVYCKEILEKTTLDYKKREVNARFVAVADPDPKSPGRMLGKELGLLTFDDYHDLYNPQHDIHLIIISTPEKAIFEDILESKPSHIRLLPHQTFEIFWKSIRLEEHKLRDRNEEIETILNGIQDFILVITPEKEVIDVNASFLRQMDYSREEVVGHKCHEVFQRVTRKSSNCHLVCPLAKVVRDKRPHQAMLTRLDQKGETRYSELTLFPILKKNGKISKFIEISRDITERKREEVELTHRLEKMVEERTRQLEETHEKLLHKDKMSSLGKLSASVVHEINNPISGILNLTILGKRIIKEGSMRQKEIDQLYYFLDLMETETRRISRIVSNLLIFSRQSKLELKEIKLNNLIEKTLFLNSNLLKINAVKVREKLSPDLPEVVGSEDQLQQVFMNIVSNAVEAMSLTGGGVLSVETSYSAHDDEITVCFKDTGAGIPKKKMSKLFEPFFTTKKKGKGVGLGLSVAYGIIKEHGGSVYVNSKEGKGTTFKIRLPLKPSSDRVKGILNGQR